jgi:hypothetical protein
MDVNFDQLYVIEINKDIDKYFIDVFGFFFSKLLNKRVVLFVK